MFGEERDHDGGVFGALRFVNRNRVGEIDLIEFIDRVANDSAFVLDVRSLGFEVDCVNPTDVAVVDVFVVIVALCKVHPVAGELWRGVACGVEGLLEDCVKALRPHAASVHRAQHLHIAHWVEAKASRNALCHDFEDPRLRVIAVAGLYEKEVAVLRRCQFGKAAGIHRVSVLHDLAFGRLAKDLGETDDG